VSERERVHLRRKPIYLEDEKPVKLNEEECSGKSQKPEEAEVTM
jgi:hypothetical protein